jgi:hypothetical protein
MLRKTPVLLIIMLMSLIIPADIRTVFPDQEYIVIEDFNKTGAEFFSQWLNRDSDEKPYREYYIDSDKGKKFLRGTTLNDSSLSIQIGKLVNNTKMTGPSRVNWYIYNYPFLSWEWRVHMIPENGNESKGETNDSAAGIYVMFQRKNIPMAGWKYQPVNWIKYVWSSTLPVGTVLSRKSKKANFTLYDGRYVVVASGKKNLGRWITFKRNVLEDYIKLFGKKPQFNPVMVAILTDSNSTKSRAVADYANIRIYAR